MYIRNVSYLIIVLLSLCSAYYSIVGLVALFPAIAIDIIVTASILEISKLWGLHYLSEKWNSVELVKVTFLKYITAFLISTQMLLTMIGVFGHLSAGHLEQIAPLGNIQAQVTDLTERETYLVSQRKQLIERNMQMQELSAAALSKDTISKTKDNRLNSIMKDIDRQITTLDTQITDVRSQLLELKKSTNTVEAKLGPIKYAAEAIGFSKDDAVKFVIGLIMCGLEPMVAVLVIMTSKLKSKDEETTLVPVIADRPLPVACAPTYILRTIKKCDYADGSVNIDADPIDELYEDTVLFVGSPTASITPKVKKPRKPRQKKIKPVAVVQEAPVSSGFEEILSNSLVASSSNMAIPHLPELADTRTTKNIPLVNYDANDMIKINGLKLD